MKYLMLFIMLLSLPAFAADVTVGTGQQPTTFTGSLDGEVLNVENGDLGNADTSYVYFNLLSAGFNTFSVQYVLEATTLTIEGTNDKPQVDNASSTWSDITYNVTDGATTSITATGSLSVMYPMAWSKIRIKRVTTNATNACKLVLTRMRIN